MTEDQRQIVWRFIKHLNRLGSTAMAVNALNMAEIAASPDRTHAEQEKAMVRVAMLIGEYEP